MDPIGRFIFFILGALILISIIYPQMVQKNQDDES